MTGFLSRLPWQIVRRLVLAATAGLLLVGASAHAQSGYTQTMLGRRRYLPDLTSDNRQRREMAERMAARNRTRDAGGSEAE